MAQMGVAQPPAAVTTGERPYASWRFAAPVLLFYAVSALPVLELLSNNLRVTSDVAAWVTGAAIVATVHRANNVWILLTVGFLQPFVANAAIIHDVPGFLEDAFIYRAAIEVGVACVAGGLVVSAALRTITADTFALRPWWEFITLLDDAQGRVGKAGKIITGLVRLAPAWAHIIRWLLVAR